METPIDASKSKKRNRSKWDNNCRLSLERSSNTLYESTLSQISQIKIGQFCPKNVFYIFLVNASDDKSASALSNLIEINKRYEEESSITFVSREEVMAFGRTGTDFIYPNHLKPLLLSLIENTPNSPGEITVNLESQLFKLKLIQVMYCQYVDKVKENNKQRSLESLLNVLTKECKRKQKNDEAFAKEDDKNKNQGKDDSKKKPGKGVNDVNQNENFDYTGVPLKNDGISYERNIFDYVAFYCFHGFYDADILQSLLEQVGIPVAGIINFIEQNDQSESSDLGSFWRQIEQMFWGNTTPYKYLENTILLQFHTGELSGSLAVLDEFVTMLRKVLNLKLSHLSYIERLKVHKMQHSYEVMQINCLKKYQKYLGNVPTECTNPPLVLRGLLDEVCLAMESNVSNESSLGDIKAKQKSLTKGNNAKHSFLVHDDNTLAKELKSYKSTGVSANDTLTLMARCPVLSDLDHSSNVSDLTHAHDVNPSSRQKPRDVDSLMYMFLFSKMIIEMKIPDLEPPVQGHPTNLCTFDLYEYWKHLLQKFHQGASPYEDNPYDTSIVHFQWKESLSKEVLIQKVFVASQKFLYIHKKYSPEHDNYLVVFSDKLDEFGTNLKIIDVPVRTPICIRDFCRYLAGKSSWKENHKIHTQFKASFPKAQHVFGDYSYLCEDFDSPELQHPEISFANILNNLEKCAAENLIDEPQTGDGDEHMLAYDFGGGIFKVAGQVTTFHSHDSVKVTVDNTKFLQAPDQCTFRVSCAESSLILHTSEALSSQPFLGTVILKDDTRISFSLPEEPQTECPVDVTHPDVENEIENIICDNVASGEQFVHCVDASFITRLLEGQTLDESANEVTADLLESVANARENNGMIYKVNTQLSYLKRLNSSVKLPLGEALRNVVSSAFDLPQKAATEAPRSHAISWLDIKPRIDFRVCLPNGLYIRPYLSVVDKKNVMIKQEYAVQRPIAQEEFRLFSDQGLVVIKKVDGTVRILKANGDMFDFEKLHGLEETGKIACHCPTIDDYRNKLNKLLKDDSGPSSRKGHMTSKQRHILDPKILKVLDEFQVPFLKKSITKFDGKRIKVVGNKLTQKQVCHLTSEHDFFTGEIQFERSDDFRCMFYKNGSQKITFPDGTVISTCIDVADELVEDFVYVKLSYQYEHFHYAKVKFNFDQSSEIGLNGDVAVKYFFDMDCLEVNTNCSKVCLSKDSLNFQKTCRSCFGKFDINFTPSKQGSWSPHADFLHVKDTYNKELHSDFVGNSFRNSDYIKSDLNAMKCNHVTRNQYQELFVINKDLTGEALYTNDWVECTSNETRHFATGSVTTYNRLSDENVTIVDCRKKHFVKYSERFYQTTEKVASSCGQSSPQPFYTTFKIFQKMFQSVDEIASHVSKMRQIFFNDCPDKFDDLGIYKLVVDLGNALEVYFKRNQRELPQEETEVEASIADSYEESLKCNCMKESFSMHEKIHRWKQECTKYRSEIRHMRIPIYFKSEFCKILK